MGREAWVRITAGAGLLGVLAWVVKWAALAAQGGRETAVDRAAFVVGLVLITVGATSVALRATRGSGTATTVSAAVVALVVAVLLVPVLSIVSSALFGARTAAGSEGGLVVLALAVLVAGVTGLWTSGRSPTPARAAGS